MNNKWLIASLGLLISVQVSAQVVTNDSINTLKLQKEALQISAELNERKLKLASLENKLIAKTRLVDKTAEQAQTSADDNGKAAERLTNDAQDKKKASKANNAAGDAQRDSKKARKAAESLEDLTSDIEALKVAIANDEKKLAAMPDHPF